MLYFLFFFFFQAEDGIRDHCVTGVQTCALPIWAASMWDPNIGFGTVTHQNIGYLFPMGPYYWLLNAMRVPDWISQRLWLGTLVFFAGLGVLYLMRTLGVKGPGVAVAALAYMFSPYSLDYAARISVLLMPWAALG